MIVIIKKNIPKFIYSFENKLIIKQIEEHLNSLFENGKEV